MKAYLEDPIKVAKIEREEEKQEKEGDWGRSRE